MKPSHGRLPVIASLVFLAAFCLAPGIAKAAPQVITMTPTSTSQTIQPGSTYKGSFQVFNQGQTAYAFQVYSAPYHVRGEDYTPDFTVLPSAPDVKGWFTFSTTGTYLAPGQSATVD
jgi:P pilus assembly chaperone PapD